MPGSRQRILHSSWKQLHIGHYPIPVLKRRKLRLGRAWVTCPWSPSPDWRQMKKMRSPLINRYNAGLQNLRKMASGGAGNALLNTRIIRARCELCPDSLLTQDARQSPSFSTQEKEPTNSSETLPGSQQFPPKGTDIRMIDPSHHHFSNAFELSQLFRVACPF